MNSSLATLYEDHPSEPRPRADSISRIKQSNRNTTSAPRPAPSHPVSSKEKQLPFAPEDLTRALNAVRLWVETFSRLIGTFFSFLLFRSYLVFSWYPPTISTALVVTVFCLLFHLVGSLLFLQVAKAWSKQILFPGTHIFYGWCPIVNDVNVHVHTYRLRGLYHTPNGMLRLAIDHYYCYDRWCTLKSYITNILWQ